VNTNILFSDWAMKNVWHMYTVTWDGSNVVRYFDAVPTLTNAQPVPFYHVERTANWLALGVQHGSHVQTSPSFGWLNGSLADIRIYNRSLSLTNVQDLFNFISPPPAQPDPNITDQPDDITVTAPAPGIFNVVASGTAPITYQWNRNGASISGATLAAYTTPPTSALSDNGAQFQVIVTNGTNGTIASRSAILTVNPAVQDTNGTFRATNFHIKNGRAK
jgi:hypothetical protein